MDIGIDATAISATKGGASYYIINIISAIAKIDKDNNYTIFCTKLSTPYFQNLPNNFKILICAPQNVVLRLIWEQTLLPFYYCKQNKIEVLYSPNYTTPLLKPGFKSIVTIFDLSFFPLSKLYPIKRRLFKPIIKLSCKYSNHIIAISQSTKRDIIKYLGNYSEKINVIYCAAHKRFYNHPEQNTVNSVLKKYQINKPYILFAGFKEPRKNLKRLIEAYVSISNKIEHTLVIVGGNGWWAESTFDLVKKSGIEKRIQFTGYIPEEELPAFYTGATLFTFPSLYEGFGIAALESICCNTPVLASDNTSLPEVVQNAGVLVNPYNTNDIAIKMFDLLTNNTMSKNLKKNCADVANQFSWEKTAKETIDLFKLNIT